MDRRLGLGAQQPLGSAADEVARYEAYLEGALAQLEHELGELTRAYTYADRSLSGFREVKDPGFQAIALARRGAIAFEMGHASRAWRDFDSAREQLRHTSQPWVRDGVETLARIGEEAVAPASCSTFSQIASRIVAASRRRGG